MGKEITLRNYFNRFPVELLHSRSPLVASPRYEFPFLPFLHPPFFFFSSGGGKVEKCLSRSFARVTFLAREHEFDGFFFLSFSFPRERKG